MCTWVEQLLPQHVHRRSRMLKKSASVVLALNASSTYPRVRLGPFGAAALLTAFLSILRYSCSAVANRKVFREASCVRFSVLDTVGRRGALSYEFGERAPARYSRARLARVPGHFPPSYLDDSGCAYTWLVNPSGGLVGGDHVSVEAQVHAGTHVLMTSPSAIVSIEVCLSRATRNSSYGWS